MGDLNPRPSIPCKGIILPLDEHPTKLAPALGLEPRTTRVTAEHSAIELDRNLELSEDARGYARDKPCDEPAAFRPSGVGFDDGDLRVAHLGVVN